MNKDNPFKVDLTQAQKDKIFYALAMFPYPSGAGLHVGHAMNFTANDIMARFKRMQGFSVLNPIGWDSFGLPTEGYAMKVGKPASEVTAENVASFINQCKMMDWSYDWDREFATSSPEYYKWTQWIFQQLFKAGLVYRKEAFVNWCPFDQTVLANDQVVDGKCERCGTEVTQKKHMQWFIKITDYAERLINDLDTVDWPEETKTQQKYWIGKSEGAEIDFAVSGDTTITVFTTRPDTIYGVTAIVLAPENETIDALLSSEKKEELEAYRKATGKKTALERQQDAEEKSGMFSGVSAKHPLTGEQVPVWFADYVLPDYATGAVMFVPAHDERDFAFAKKHEIATKDVIAIHYISGNAPKEGKQTIERRNVLAMLLDEEEKNVLCIDWKTQDWKSFIMGGVESGENMIEAGAREITEETGYSDLEFMQVIPGEIHAEYYVAHKDVNRYSYENCVVYKLKSKNNTGKIEGEDVHSLKWIPIQDVDEFLSQTPGGVNSNLVFFRRYNANNAAYTGAGVLINSGIFDGLVNTEAKQKIIDHLEKNGLGKRKITYKLRDWSVSRQRYWGSPIPVYYDEQGNPQLIPEDELPVVLPLDLGNYKPAGKSPLADHPTFPHYTPANTKVPYFKYTDEVWGVKEGVETKKRTVVQAIIKDKNSDTYLMLKWKVDGTLGFVIGGVESGENKIEALKREIEEEAGFKDVKVIRQIGGESHRHLYHALKGHNQYTDAYCYYVEVDKKDQQPIASDELEKHEPVWLTKEQILKDQTDPDIPYQFGLLYNPETKAPVEIDRFNEYNPQSTYLRECDTLDTFMCSSFYYIRFADPQNEKELISKELADKTLPVDFYIGGREHTYGHLLYSRFIHKFLFDQGYLPSAEPFKKLIHQGFVLGADGRKMSKRWGNVINPSEVVEEFGSDTTRTYTMFMGPLEQEKVWNPNALSGVKKFIERVERLEQFVQDGVTELDGILHKTIKGVTEDIERIKFNTAVSKLMVFVNEVYDKKAISKEQLAIFLQLLAPFATRLTQEMWERYGNEGNIHFSSWPVADPAKMAEDTMQLPVQISGKMKGTLEIATGLSQDDVMAKINADERFASQLTGKEIAKIIYVQDKIINIIVK